MSYTFVTGDERLRIVEMYGEGKSCQAIGAEVGRASRTVWGILKKAGVELRPHELDDLQSLWEAQEGLYVPGNVQWVHKDINRMILCEEQQRDVRSAQTHDDTSR